MFHVTRFVPPQKTMKYKDPNPNCKCGNPRRPGGRYCYVCHAEKQKAYRERMKNERVDTSGMLAQAVRDFKRKLVMKTMREEGGNLTRTAFRLGVHRNTMNRLMFELGLNAKQVRTWLREDSREEVAA